jgi:hypothetical protein
MTIAIPSTIIKQICLFHIFKLDSGVMNITEANVAHSNDFIRQAPIIKSALNMMLLQFIYTGHSISHGNFLGRGKKCRNPGNGV